MVGSYNTKMCVVIVTISCKDNNKLTAYTDVGWSGRVYGISTIVGYLMPHPVYTYILNI